MQISTVSSKGQTTIPIKIRKLLGLNPGSNVYWQIDQSKNQIKKVLVSSPSEKSLEKLRGSAKDLYRKHGGGKKYLQNERKSWQ